MYDFFSFMQIYKKKREDCVFSLLEGWKWKTGIIWYDLIEIDKYDQIEIDRQI